VKRIFRLRRLGKKAQEQEQQFNWIFILIVGALILGFFGYVVIKQKAASETKLAITMVKQLNTVITGAKLSSGTFQDIPIPETTIRFTCDDYFVGDASQRLGNRIVFAPEFVSGNRLMTWTLDWNVPFKVTGFLYLTSPYVRYILVRSAADDKGLAEKINSTLPAKLNKELIKESELASVSDENDRRVRIVVVGGALSSAPSIPPALSGADVSAVVIDSGTKQVQFYGLSGSSLVASGPPMRYLDEEGLYGAIFAEKAEDYQCSINKAFGRLNSAAKIFSSKFNLIADSFKGTACEGFYRNNQDFLDLVRLTDDAKNIDFEKIPATMQSLVNSNTRLQLNSCPLLF
jgi:hypothetical protein